MQKISLRNEINHLNGALEAPGLLREKLNVQQDKMGSESGREAVDGMLAQINNLLIEYQQHRINLHPLHKSYQLLLNQQGIHTLLYNEYIDLIRGKRTKREFSDQSLRLTDWYVRMEDCVPPQLVNETYRWLFFINMVVLIYMQPRRLKNRLCPRGKSIGRSKSSFYH